jgi:hypothetical protein
MGREERGREERGRKERGREGKEKEKGRGGKRERKATKEVEEREGKEGAKRGVPTKLFVTVALKTFSCNNSLFCVSSIIFGPCHTIFLCIWATLAAFLI